MPSAYRLARLDQPPAFDWGLIIARLKRLTGASGGLLAVALKIAPRRLNAIENGSMPTWPEGDALLRALRACGSDPGQLVR